MKKVLICGVCAALAGCGGASTGGLSPIASQADLDRFNVEILPQNTDQDTSFGSILNSLRSDNGLAPVTYDARLDQAAQDHAEDMIARGFFAHTNPDGETEFDRIVAAGYNPSAWGENLAGRQPTEADALVAWINSPEHNRLLRASTVEDFGLGLAGDGEQRRWVLVMATER